MSTSRLSKKLSAAGIYSFLLFSVLIAGCKSNNMSTNPPGNSPGTNEVWMQSDLFNPSSLTVSAGTTVQWTNKDNVVHTVTSGTPSSPSGLFDSGNISANGTFSYTFSTTGTYQYYCRVHAPMMAGTIVVK